MTSFTRYVGPNAGVEGSRIVKDGGKIIFCNETYQHDRLIPFVGEEVFVWDADGELYIYTAEYPLYSSIKNPFQRCHRGKLIINFKPSPG